MTNVIQRQRSRRKLAALTFLSNISLDGTHRDTKLSRYNLGTTLTKSLDPGDSNILLKPNSKYLVTEGGKRDEDPNIEEDTSSNNIVIRVPSQNSFREKFYTNEFLDRSVLRKRSHHASVGSERVYHLSSNESLGGNLTGIPSRTRKLSSTYSECSVAPNREIRFYKKASGLRIRHDYVIILACNKLPCHIFSYIPYKKSSEHYRDGSKRHRHASGTRPLSTISDSTDPSHIIGMVCIEEALEISYCDLLVPSHNFFVSTVSKRHLSSYSESSEFSDRLVQHPGVSRCFSYDPTSHKSSGLHNPLINTGCPHEIDDAQVSFSSSPMYVPNMLDDPELRAGKHRKLLRFPSYMTSLIDYTKPTELKKELNDKFRERFPRLRLTLSKLRSLKREMAKIARSVEFGMEVHLTVAHAYVYFEQLILKTIVNKSNRKLIAGACLILSAKMNDVKGDQLSNLIEKTESIFRLNRRELILWEFASLVSLEFSLHIPTWMVAPHYQRLLSEA